MLNLWTAPYRYSGPYRLDITVKGNDPIGRFFAPTWDMVMDHKKTGNNETYIAKYHQMMINSYNNNRHIWKELLSRENLVIVCFCGSDAFCHRFLLANYLQQLGAIYHGEIKGEEPKKVINSFRDEFTYMSNTYPCLITHEGITYNSTEHMFQAYKYNEDATIFVPQLIMGKEVLTKVNARKHIASLPEWREAKKLGRKAILHPDWEEVESIRIMDLCIDLKFQPGSWFGKMLLATGNADIIEGNKWHDNKWGNCTCAKCTGIPGRNLLGKSLMRRRDQLK